MDLLGFGFSDKPTDINYSIIKQADLVEEVYRKCKLNNCTLFVHDYGVSIGQELLARINNKNRENLFNNNNNIPLSKYNFEMNGICFLNGGLFPETHRAKLIQKILNSFLGKYLSKLSSPNSIKKSLSSVFTIKPTEEELNIYCS